MQSRDASKVVFLEKHTSWHRWSNHTTQHIRLQQSRTKMCACKSLDRISKPAMRSTRKNESLANKERLHCFWCSQAASIADSMARPQHQGAHPCSSSRAKNRSLWKKCWNMKPLSITPGKAECPYHAAKLSCAAETPASANMGGQGMQSNMHSANLPMLASPRRRKRP